MFDKFNCVRKKWRHGLLSVRHTISNCMAIMNIREYIHYVKDLIYKKDDNEWEFFMSDYAFIWDKDIVPVFYNVSYVLIKLIIRMNNENYKEKRLVVMY